LSSCGDVTGTEIGHGGNARSFGNYGRLGNLKGGTNGADSRRMDTMRKMVHGLAMRADQRHIARLEFRLPNHVQRRIRKPFTKQRIEVTDIRDRPRN
jgi:hypothetical protein